MDRTIHFGDDAADARYRIQDTSSTGGDLVLAEDLDGGTVLLEYDYSASEWVSRGPVNLDGNDITNAGSISADTLDAGDLTIKKDGSFGAIDKIANYQYDSGPNSFDETRDVSGVSQTAATISQLPDNTGAYGTVLVQGLGDAGERFFEFVEFLRGKSAQVISDPPFLLGSPAGRTYSVTQNSLQLAMSSGTYDVQTRTTSLRGGL